MPDIDWCPSAIAALDPQHLIFEPGYMPAKSQRGRRGCKYIPKAEELVFMIDFKQNKSERQVVSDRVGLDYNEK